MISWLSLFCLLLAQASMLQAASEGYLDRANRVNGWSTRSVFDPLYEKHRSSVVEILEDGHQIALGTVVSEDGFIVTKASDFGMSLEVRDATHTVYVPEFISVDPDNDLALLKIKADGLQPVKWSEDETHSMGQWVVSPHEDETQVRVGVISATQRPIPKKPGALGIKMINGADSLTSDSFKDFGHFISILEKKEKPLDQFIAEQLTLTNEEEEAVKTNQISMADLQIMKLNRAIFRRTFFDDELLDGVHLSADTEKLMAIENPRDYRSVINLMVLEDAFPDDIIRKRKGGRITDVTSGSSAERAQMLAGDLIISVDDKPVFTTGDVARNVQKHGPGEKVQLRILRGDQEIVETVTLGYFDSTFPDEDVNIVLSGDISVRRTGYEQVIQHEIPLPPKAMGGPLFGLDGKVVGVNIARYDRVATFALPAALVRSSIEKLK